MEDILLSFSGIWHLSLLVYEALPTPLGEENLI